MRAAYIVTFQTAGHDATERFAETYDEAHSLLVGLRDDALMHGQRVLEGEVTELESGDRVMWLDDDAE